MRLLIIGGPGTGKTTSSMMCLSAQPMGTTIRLTHTDDLIPSHTWSAMSDVVCRLIEQPGPWIIEGAAGVRGLRKWLRKHPEKPDFEILYLDKPFVSRTVGQVGMAKGIETIWRECQDMMKGRV